MQKLELEPLTLPAAPRMVAVGGEQIAVRRAGDGPPIVLLHGMPTSSHLWDAVAPQLTDEFDVVAPDLLGFGRSQPRHEAADIRVAAQAELMAQLIPALGLAPALVVGHDVGGGVAQLLALRHPELLAGLVLIDSVWNDSWPIWEMRLLRRLENVLVFQPSRWTWAMVAGSVRRALESETPPPAVDECLAQWRGRDGARALVRAVRALDSSATREIAADLEGLRHPTLVVWGAHDVYQSVASGRALSAAIPGSRFELAGGAGHFVPWDEPAELAGLIASFYRGIR